MLQKNHRHRQHRRRCRMPSRLRRPVLSSPTIAKTWSLALVEGTDHARQTQYKQNLASVARQTLNARSAPICRLRPGSRNTPPHTKRNHSKSSEPRSTPACLKQSRERNSVVLIASTQTLCSGCRDCEGKNRNCEPHVAHDTSSHSSPGSQGDVRAVSPMIFRMPSGRRPGAVAIVQHLCRFRTT